MSSGAGTIAADSLAEVQKEIDAAISAAANASPDDEIRGLGPSTAPVYLQSCPSKPKAQYSTPSEQNDPFLLTYFTIQGLGEVPKLMLAESQTPYNCLSMIGGEDQSSAMEWRKRSPNGLLPLLSGGGIPRSSPISQSGSIIRFLAKTLGMEGGDDVLSTCRADMLYETSKDLSDHKSIIASVNPDKDESAAKGPFALAKRVEKMLTTMSNPKDEDAAMNYGQLQLLQVLLCCEARREGCVKENLGEVLDTFRINMSNRAGLKEYLSSTARFPLTKGELGQPGGYVYATGPLKRGDIQY